MTAATREGVVIAWTSGLQIPLFVLIYAQMKPDLFLTVALSLAVYIWSSAAAHVVETLTRPGRA